MLNFEDKIFDAIIVGSGPAGVSAAWPLVKSGKEVLMIDVGYEPSNDSQLSNKNDNMYPVNLQTNPIQRRLLC